MMAHLIHAHFLEVWIACLVLMALALVALHRALREPGQ